MITGIKSSRIILGDDLFDGYLYFEDDKILKVTHEFLPCDELLDYGNMIVSPGFIDLHVHGAVNCDFCSSSPQQVAKAVNFHLDHGTTTIMPTVTSVEFDAIKTSLQNISKCIAQNLSDANIYGVHLEGPYFSPKQCGAQNPDNIMKPNKVDYEALVKQFPSLIKRWSFAPELSGSGEFCEFISKNGIMSSIGHSDAVYEDCMTAIENGCRMVTHLYSCTSTVTRDKGFRRLGVIETAFLCDDLYVEIIADGCHLPPELIKMIVKIKGEDKVCLVTDAMQAAGVNTERSVIGGVECIIEDSVAKLVDRSAFAGSIATADRLVRTCVKQAKIPITSAVKMITDTPASLFGMNKGRLKEGMDADIVAFDDDINIAHVFVKGKKIR